MIGRIAVALPRTPTFKVLTRLLAADRWNTRDPVWWRPQPRAPLREMTGADRAEVRELFARNERTALLPG